MKKDYVYPCVFEKEEENISVVFPDFDEAYTDGKTTEEAYKNAIEVLKLTIKSRLKDKETLPKATDIIDMKLGKNQISVLIYVSVEDRIVYDKKTLTIPHDLNVAAEIAGINFSQVLQEALREKLLHKV